ncbi:MAG: Gfo/Idh/MocA family oxidoreductase [Phycisphaeraceae bacterium]|nr:Gfo/Idh/MocA family oxidoreductase [Phycisphaeraceae bacterium]
MSIGRAEAIGVGVIGLGFMGRTHVAAYQAAERDGFPCRVVAVCDPDPARRAGIAPAEGGNISTGATGARLFDPSRVRGHETAERLLADPAVHLVSICTYTDSHVDLALAALAAGKHVLVEKPVALRSGDVESLALAARAAASERGLCCMPAMCMRFWPGWSWLRERVRDGSLGAVRSATFQRLGSGPTWSAGFYRDASRSGGALFDLHVHDADFVHWCFGPPREVFAVGDAQHVTASYVYGPGGPAHVAAEGAWDLAPGAGFRMRYLVNFDRATAEFDLSRSPALVLHTESGTSAVEADEPGVRTGYDGQVRRLLETIAADRTDAPATIDEAAAVTRMLEAERESQASRLPVSVGG